MLHYTYVRDRRSPLLIGATAGLAYFAHPLAGLFVVPSLIVECVRGQRRALQTLGVLAATVLPWQLWTALYAHTSRMLTYPLGYTMRDPSNLKGELRIAWDQFGLGHALHVRLDEVVDTLWPFDLRRNLLSLPGALDGRFGGVVHGARPDPRWDGAVRARAGLRDRPHCVAPPGAVGAHVDVVRAATLAVLFWGIDPQGLGAALLQPTGALLVVVATGGLLAIKRPIALIWTALAVAEAASVVWWGLFSARDGASTPEIVVAATLCGLPAIGALMTVASRTRDSTPTGSAGCRFTRRMIA